MVGFKLNRRSAQYGGKGRERAHVLDRKVKIWGECRATEEGSLAYGEEEVEGESPH